MNDVERLLLLNRFCDEFEATLRASEPDAEIGSFLESTKKQNDDPQFLEELLGELIALKVAYSDDRDATAETLKSQYPDCRANIEQAMQQPSLLGTIGATRDDTKAETPGRTRRSKSPKKIDAAGSRFENLELFASGGLGDVYSAYDKTVKRKVAVKLLKPELVGHAEAKSRFLREGAITGSLEHPAIVPIYDSGISDNGQPFYAMRLLQGATLKGAIEELHADPSATGFKEKQRALVRRLADICDAISYAHDEGVIHRDLKPANILLGDYGETVLIDWGLARREASEDVEHSSGENETDSKIVGKSELQTQLGHVLGTPEYMSPEQASGDPASVGKWSDIYSLGAVLYCILTGNSPTGTVDLKTSQRVEAAAAAKHQTARERMPSVNRAIDAICARAMHVSPAERYPSANELAKDLDAWLSDLPVQAKPDSLLDKSARFLRKHQRWAAAAALTLVAVTVGSLVATSVIQKQSSELALRKVEAEEQSRIQTDLAQKEAESARNARESAFDSNSYRVFMNSFFQDLQPDAGGRDIKLIEVLDALEVRLLNEERLPSVTRRNIMSTISQGYLAARKDKKAIEMIRRYVQASIELYGAESTGTIDAKGALVAALSRVGFHAEGLALADETLAILRTTDHEPNGWARSVDELENDIMHHRLSCLAGLGKHDDLRAGWEELYPWLLELDIDNLPTDDDKLHFANQYVEVLRKSGDEERALKLQEKLLDARKKKSNPKSSAALGNLYRLAKSVKKEKGSNASLPYEKELVELAVEVLGPEHPNTLVARANLADSLYFVGRYEESNEKFRELQNIYQRQGSHLPNLLTVETKLARLELVLGNEKSALELLESIVNRAEQSEDIPPAVSTNTIALFYLSVAQIENGQYGEAVKTIEKEIGIFTAAKNSKELEDTTLWGRLQLAYMLQGDFDAALKLREHFSGEVGRHTIMESSQTATSLFELGQAKEAQILAEKILSLRPPEVVDFTRNAPLKCIQADMKGLLSKCVAKEEPLRSRKLLLESVSELHEGFPVQMQVTRVRGPLMKHGSRLLELLEKNGESELASEWRSRLAEAGKPFSRQ